MNFEAFRAAVDGCPDEITQHMGDLESLYKYVGLPIGSALSRNAASDELYRKVVAAFTSGHQAVWQQCRRLREELIQRHVIDGAPLDPYFAVLGPGFTRYEHSWDKPCWAAPNFRWPF